MVVHQAGMSLQGQSQHQQQHAFPPLAPLFDKLPQKESRGAAATGGWGQKDEAWKWEVFVDAKCTSNLSSYPRTLSPHPMKRTQEQRFIILSSYIVVSR
jgi:hypothetical protein